jgi:4-amino-4-deoxy-L-arabinose transferase-like glycosyltransferase
MKWTLLTEAADDFWKHLTQQAEAVESRARFPWLSRPAVHVTILAVLAFTFCLGGLAVNKTLEGDEALYALVPKTIVITGEWMHLSFNGQPYFFKPPLNFWITAALFHVLPMTASTAALGSALFGAFCALMIYLLCRAMFPGWEWAFCSTLVFLTTHEALHWTRGVHLETVQTFWTLVGLLAAYVSVKRPSAIVGMGVAAGLGWLAKGPQSLFPGAVALLLWKSEGIARRRIVSFWSIASGVALILILAPWLLSRLQEGSGFAQGYFGKELRHTLFGPTQLRNGPFFYPARLAVTYWPWLPAAVVGFFLLGRGWRRSVGAKLWILYAGVVVVLIMLTAEKRMRYLFQLYPALSVAAGAAAALAVRRYPRLLRAFIVLAMIGAVTLTIVARKGNRPPPTTRDAVEVARRLTAEDRAWLTRRSARSDGVDASVAKTIGFYAAPLLHACATQCDEEAVPGAVIIARADEAEETARRLKGRVDFSNPTLALVKIP